MPHRHVIPYRQARKLAKSAAAPHSWREVAGAFRGEVWPEFSPSFRIRAGEVVFTMGSCFARNIESHLAMLGCKVPMLDFDLPPAEWSGGLHGAMNRFHPPAFRQILDWTGRIYDRDGRVSWTDCQEIAFDCGDGAFFDLDMGSTAPVGQARFIERRQHVYDIFSTVFSASCLMMTPGLVEAWRDRRTGLYIHSTPRDRAMLSDPDRWELEVLSYEVCHADLLASIDLARTRNPELKVLITTSPVPLSTTFTGEDVRVANTHSKSVLRAVCGTVKHERPLVDYFPSFESVTLSFPEGVWKDDRLHVTHGFIAKIVTRMLDRYLDGVDEADREQQRARLHLLAGEAEEAEARARAALQLRADHAAARLDLARALTLQGRFAQAEAELEPLMERHGERPDVRLALAHVLAASPDGRVAEAVEHIRTALALPGASMLDLLSALGVVRQDADPKSLEPLARQIIALFPLHVESYAPLARLLLDQQRWPEAIELLQHAVGLRRAPAEMHLWLGNALRKAGRPAEARLQADLALRRDPDDAKAKALQARLAAEAQAS